MGRTGRTGRRHPFFSLPLTYPATLVHRPARGRAFVSIFPGSDNSFCMGNFKNRLTATHPHPRKEAPCTTTAAATTSPPQQHLRGHYSTAQRPTAAPAQPLQHLQQYCAETTAAPAIALQHLRSCCNSAAIGLRQHLHLQQHCAIIPYWSVRPSKATAPIPTITMVWL